VRFSRDIPNLFAVSEPNPMITTKIPSGIVKRVYQITTPPPAPSQVPHSLRGLPPGGVIRIAIAMGRTAINTPKSINQSLAFGFSGLLLVLIKPLLSHPLLTQSNDYQSNPQVCKCKYCHEHQRCFICVRQGSTFGNRNVLYHQRADCHD